MILTLNLAIVGRYLTGKICILAKGIGLIHDYLHFYIYLHVITTNTNKVKMTENIVLNNTRK